MPKKATKKVKVFDQNITAQEDYYLNNPNLPKETSDYDYTPEMVEAMKRCREDIIYFAENHFYINGINGKEVISLFEKQKKILRSIQNNKKNLLVTSRQWGKSTLMTIVAVWTALFFPDQTIAIVANKQSTATEIFGRVRLAFLQMDNWLKGGVREFNKTYFTLANGSRIITSATSPDAIRGLSIDVLLLDEFGVIPPKMAEDFWAAVTPTLASRFNNNKNAKLIIASTPKGIGNKFHELVRNSEQGKNDFHVEKAYWYDFPGRDEVWKENELKSMGYHLFQQEYECKFLNNAGSPFDPDMFTKLEEERIEPINILDNGNYLIWAKPDKDKIYTMGVDSGEGLGRDFSVIQIFDITDPMNIEQVACYKTNKMDTTSWGLKVYEIAKQWYSPIAVIERNGPGSGICDKFFYEWNYPRLVCCSSADVEKLRNTKNKLPGMLASRNTKSRAVTNMKYYVHDRRCVKIHDKVTVDELRTFANLKTPSGNTIWKAQEGFHDDHVMAMVWALQTLHSSSIDDFLIVEEKNAANVPLKIRKKWTFTATDDYSDSLYKMMDNESPYIGVMAIKDSNNHINAFYGEHHKSKAEPGSLAYLLDSVEAVPLSSYNKTVTDLPSSFMPYMWN